MQCRNRNPPNPTEPHPPRFCGGTAPGPPVMCFGLKSAHPVLMRVLLCTQEQGRALGLVGRPLAALPRATTTTATAVSWRAGGRGCVCVCVCTWRLARPVLTTPPDHAPLLLPDNASTPVYLQGDCGSRVGGGGGSGTLRMVRQSFTHTPSPAPAWATRALGAPLAAAAASRLADTVGQHTNTHHVHNAQN